MINMETLAKSINVQACIYEIEVCRVIQVKMCCDMYTMRLSPYNSRRITPRKRAPSTTGITPYDPLGKSRRREGWHKQERQRKKEEHREK